MAKVRVAMSAYNLVARAVEEGARYGWSRLWKHRERPEHLSETLSDEDAVTEITDHVLEVLCETIDFDKSAVAVPLKRRGLSTRKSAR